MRSNIGDEATVGFLVQRDRRPVDVLGVLFRDDAELGKVEVGVHRLQRIVSPLDQVEPHREGPVALQQLQRLPEAGAAMLGDHAGHVRPLGGLAVLDARERVDEPDHPVAVEGANQDAAAVTETARMGPADLVVRATDLALQFDACANSEGRQIR